MAAGFAPAGFGELSLREYHAHMTGARDRLKAEQEARAWSVWHSAALRRMEKLPSFREFTRGGDRGPQDAQEQQAMFDMLAAAWGAAPA